MSTSSPSSWWDTTAVVLPLLRTAATYAWAGLVLGTAWSVRFTTWLFAVATWPVTAGLGVLLFIVSPALLVAQYASAPVFWAVALFPRLEVFYMFFGCAACVGFLTGAALQLTSSGIASALGMHQPSQSTDPAPCDRDSEDGLLGVGRDEWPTSMRGMRWGDEGFSSQESSDLLYWSSADKDRLLGKGKGKGRRIPGMLQQQTILEEVDSSES